MAHDLTLASTLMVCITLFQTDGGYGVYALRRVRRRPGRVILEFDPFT